MWTRLKRTYSKKIFGTSLCLAALKLRARGVCGNGWAKARPELGPDVSVARWPHRPCGVAPLASSEHGNMQKGWSPAVRSTVHNPWLVTVTVSALNRG